METRTASVQRMIALPQNGSGERSTVSIKLRPLPPAPPAL